VITHSMCDSPPAMSVESRYAREVGGRAPATDPTAPAVHRSDNTSQVGLRAREGDVPAEPPSRAERSGVVVRLDSPTVAGAAPELVLVGPYRTSRFTPRPDGQRAPERNNECDADHCGFQIRCARASRCQPTIALKLFRLTQWRR
jgi:hypothetical protein